MFRKARAVIGAGYGDEGKGLLTDYHGSNGADAVVRTNGGAQAGHTVVTPDGRRHVFHHVGSAAFLNIPTHLSKDFILNPVFLKTELDDLDNLGVKPLLSADPRSLVTTPYDMIINQIAEIARGSARHGSCGLGIGETVERNLQPDLALQFRDLLADDSTLLTKLQAIREQWVMPRLARLGVVDVPDQFHDVLTGDGLIERFVADCREFRELVRRLDDRAVVGELIFEGAQGLLLDQDYGAFPHVTRSNTGLKNMVDFCVDAGISHIDATFATRCYTTRHGAGPLAHVDAQPTDWLTMVDPTNAPNPWQGAIRAAPLDTAVLGSAIRFDLGYASGLVSCQPHLSVSCLDQIADGFRLFDGNKEIVVSPADASERISQLVDLPVVYQSFGPTRSTIIR
jgi:adenylosuccinate synthase